MTGCSDPYVQQGSGRQLCNVWGHDRHSECGRFHGGGTAEGAELSPIASESIEGSLAFGKDRCWS